jgi:hypothetical protein
LICLERAGRGWADAPATPLRSMDVRGVSAVNCSGVPSPCIRAPVTA